MRKFLLGTSFFMICLTFISLHAQKPEDLLLSKNLVIENVMLVKKPGETPQKSTIVIEDGVITQVGLNSSVPADAIVISGDSLFAYSAFIDACSHTGIPKPNKDGKQAEVKDPDKPGWKRAGITPNMKVDDNIKMNESSVKEMRSAGFAISHAVPRGRMLAGQGSIILLNEGENASYIKENVSLYGSLQSAAGRVYPSTVIAVMAKYREIIRQARISQKHEMKYKTNPIGLKRPSYPKEIQALYPAVSGTQPFFMRAEKTLDISRALALNKDLKLKMTIVEAKQAWHNLDKIRNSQTSLLLSLDLPEKIKEEKKDSTAKVNVEREALVVRKKTAIEEYQSQFKVMRENNFPVSFSFIEVKPKDIHKNIMLLLEKEVKVEEIHAALTTNPAKLLGIESISGTVEKGKLGNIILTDKALFEKEMKIHYTIVEGKMYKHDVKKKKKKKKKSGNGDDESIDISGKWDITVQIPGSEQTAQLVFKKDASDYTGVLIDDEGEETELENIEIDGNSLSFTFVVQDDGMTLDLEMTTEIDGNSINGSVNISEMGSFPVEGTRKETPKK